MIDTNKLSFVANDRGLRDVLAGERDEALKYLIQSGDPVAIHRAQGRVKLVEELLAALDFVKGARG